MSGDLIVEPASVPLAPHHRLILDLEDGFRLAFNDARKFGRVWLTASPEIVLGRLGPEPLDNSFSCEELSRRLQEHRRMLKPLLMDQSFLAGLGNIYTDEALHLARLHPCRNSDTLSQAEVTLLWGSIRQVLLDGIARSGQYRLGLSGGRFPELLACLPAHRRALLELWHTHCQNDSRAEGNALLSLLPTLTRKGVWLNRFLCYCQCIFAIICNKSLVVSVLIARRKVWILLRASSWRLSS
jgi:hypothetical protein